MRSVWLVLLLSLLCRAWISAILPMTGDEALFYWWAQFLDYGYYDHPPMVGWWIAGVVAALGHAEWVVRLPATLLPLGVAGAIWWGFAPIDRVRATWAVLLYSLMPINWLGALVTTDTPLIFWAAWSVAALTRAEWTARSRQDQGRSAWHWYVLSGACLGMAFLSKYFAVLLGVAYVVYFGLWARSHWRGLILGLLAMLPAVGVNVMWNLQHCWTNIMFNLFNRNEDAVFAWANPLTYLVTLVYLISPMGLWWMWRARSGMRSAMRWMPWVACAAWVPLALFALMSGKKVIGLHWVLGFYPFLFILLAWALSPDQRQRLARALTWFVAAHVVLAAGVSFTSLQDWKHMKLYHRLVEAARAPDIAKQAQAPDTVLMANVYSAAALYGYAVGQHVPVFGVGGFHARQDDLITDYRQFDGRTLRIIAGRKAPDLSQYQDYFAAVRVMTLNQDGVAFYVVEGRGFRYDTYRSQVLSQINESYYRFPSWLPVWGCSFCERYCGSPRCQP